MPPNKELIEKMDLIRRMRIELDSDFTIAWKHEGEIKKLLDDTYNKCQRILFKDYHIKDDTYRKLVANVVPQLREQSFAYSKISLMLDVDISEVIRLGRYGINSFSEEIKVNVRKRDKHQCQDCGLKEKKEAKHFHVHHKGDSQDHSLGNLILFCPKCHKKADTQLKSNT